MSNIYGKFLNWFLNTWFWAKVGIFCARFTFRWFDYTLFPVDDYFKILDKLEPSKEDFDSHYIFLSTDTKTLSSMLIKLSVSLTGSQNGLFSHAGLILVDGDRNTKAMHVNHAGFQYQSLLAHLKEFDYLAVIKLPIKKGCESIIQQRVEVIKAETKKIVYDWQESLDNDQYHIYCSEMLYMIFKDLVDDPNFKPRIISGKYYFDPDLLLNVGGEMIYCNHPNVKV